MMSKHLCHVHYEASDAMRDLYALEGRADEGMDEFALRRLAFDPAVVPKLILATAGERGHRHIVVSGLRSPTNSLS